MFLYFVYNVNGDQYTGAWLHNKKHGRWVVECSVNNYCFICSHILFTM